MTKELSEEYASGQRVIKTIQEIDLDMWREGSIWLNDAVYIKDNDDNEEEEVYYVGTSKSKEKIDFNIETIRELNGKKFKSFDHYVKKRHNMFHTVALNLNSWMDSRCDCYSFRKKYSCKHIVGLALRNKCCKLPRKALTVKPQKKNNRGRKPESTSALKK